MRNRLLNLYRSKDEFFWQNVESAIVTQSGCIERKDQIKKNHDQSMYRAMFVLVNGSIPKDKPYVCHKCDNGRCFNPSHLFAGSASDNLYDCVSKGRHWTQTHPENIIRGADHYYSKYPEELRGENHWSYKRPEKIKRGAQVYNSIEPNIDEIFRLRSEGLSYHKIGQLLGCCGPTIRKIVKGTHWSQRGDNYSLL